MATLRLCTLTLMAVVLLAALGASPVLGQGPSQGVSVNVINPSSQPVPVTLQGTGEVSGDVNVTNEVSVRSADNPALQPVTFEFSAHINTTSAGLPLLLVASPSFTVPPGKRLVIEYIDAAYFIGNAIGGASNSATVLLQLNDFGASSLLAHPYWDLVRGVAVQLDSSL